MKILNTDEIREIVATVQYQPDHTPLVTALRERYPEAEFNQVGMRGDWTRRTNIIVDAAGRQITDRFPEWLASEYVSVHRNLTELHHKYVDSGIRLVEEAGSTLIFTVPYGPAPDAFFQLEISASHKMATSTIFDRDWPPREFDDLLKPLFSDDPFILSSWAYETEIRLTNARRFLQDVAVSRHEEKLADRHRMQEKVVHIIRVNPNEKQTDQEVSLLDLHPDWLERPCNEIRFFTDWHESSACSHRLCDHWWLSLRNYESQGRLHLAFIPYWAIADGERVPKLSTIEDESPFALMAKIKEFDQTAGYPFAWYFYMLHGGKVHYGVGVKIAEGIKAGQIGLPTRDQAVLLRWVERQYGF